MSVLLLRGLPVSITAGSVLLAGLALTGCAIETVQSDLASQTRVAAMEQRPAEERTAPTKPKQNIAAAKKQSARTVAAKEPPSHQPGSAGSEDEASCTRVEDCGSVLKAMVASFESLVGATAGNPDGAEQRGSPVCLSRARTEARVQRACYGADGGRDRHANPQSPGRRSAAGAAAPHQEPLEPGWRRVAGRAVAALRGASQGDAGRHPMAAAGMTSLRPRQIVCAIEMAQADAPFDRPVVEREGDAGNPQ